MDNYSLKVWDKLNDMWSDLDALQGLAYIEVCDLARADEISNKLFKIKQTIIEIRDSLVD